jgi:hypothetical protein
MRIRRFGACEPVADDRRMAVGAASGVTRVFRSIAVPGAYFALAVTSAVLVAAAGWPAGLSGPGGLVS